MVGVVLLAAMVKMALLLGKFTAAAHTLLHILS